MWLAVTQQPAARLAHTWLHTRLAEHARAVFLQHHVTESRKPSGIYHAPLLSLLARLKLHTRAQHAGGLP